MLLDAQNLFSDAQAVTAAAASTNHYDLSIARDFAAGRQLYIWINVDVAMTDSGSDSTLTVDAYYDTTTTFTPDAQQRLVIIPATSAIGDHFIVALSPHASTQYRYVELYYTPNNGNLTAGSFTSALVLDAQNDFSYASGYTIS